MSFLNFFRRAKLDPETARRNQLLERGRITEGRIIDIAGDDSGQVTQVFYRYSINGVEYESSQTLAAEQRLRPATYAPGAVVVVRYNPLQPGNSVVV